MNTIVFMAVMSAASLHATWNAFVKSGNDKHVAMAAIVLAAGVGELPLLAATMTTLLGAALLRSAKH